MLHIPHYILIHGYVQTELQIYSEAIAECAIKLILSLQSEVGQ